MVRHQPKGEHIVRNRAAGAFTAKTRPQSDVGALNRIAQDRKSSSTPGCPGFYNMPRSYRDCCTYDPDLLERGLQLTLRDSTIPNWTLFCSLRSFCLADPEPDQFGA